MKFSRTLWRTLAIVTETGFTIATAIALGVIGGAWLDSHLHTRPWFFLLGLMVGFLSAGYSLYRLRFLLNGRSKSDESGNGV